MIQRMKELESLLNSIDFSQLWDGFSKTRYALYNDKYFYVDNSEDLGLDLVREDSFFVGKTDQRFAGNTAISINGHYVAIYNEDTISKDVDSKKLASLIVHEMFHCFQLARGEKRFPNELLGIDYPITVENINLRTMERQYLLDAGRERDKQKKARSLALYFNVRGKREKLIGKFLDYEKAVETFEGTAVYVEYRTLALLNPGKEESILGEYLNGFAEIDAGKLKIRQSTYNQGLLLALIADQCIPDWKSKFDRSGLFLSDFIKSELQLEELSAQELSAEEVHKNIAAVEACIIEWERQRDAVFQEFEKRPSLNVIEQDVEITGFDPMNVVKRGREVIHKTFLKVKVGKTEHLIRGPVRTIIEDHIFDVRKIEW